jgi:hypothetical protein
MTPWDWYTDNCEGPAGITCEDSAGLATIITRLTQDSRKRGIQHEQNPAQMNHSLTQPIRSKPGIQRKTPKNQQISR